MRIGVFGGRFDPPHIGHLLVAEGAREALQLDELWFIPSKAPPHKGVRAEAGARHTMTLLATAEHPGFRVSDLELGRPGPSYTYDTVLELKTQQPAAQFVYLIGSDAYAEIETWHRARELVDEIPFAVYPRQGSGLTALPVAFTQGIERLNTPMFEVSSTDIRARLAAGRSVRYLVPSAVASYIAKHGLYLEGA